jgi:hypothetical protein
VTSGDELETRPDRERHDAVVDDVEERHVAKLLPGDEAELRTRFN